MIIFFAVILVLLLLGFTISSISGAPWVPARAYDVEALLDDAKIKPGSVYIELGCGDGRLVRGAAKRGAKAIGYELNPMLWAYAWVRSMGDNNVQVRLGNFWTKDISSADVVMAFLVPRTMPRLGKKADKEMKKGSMLLSYIFPIPKKKPLLKNRSWYIYSY